MARFPTSGRVHAIGKIAGGNSLVAENDEPELRRLAQMFNGPLEGERPRTSAASIPFHADVIGAEHEVQQPTEPAQERFPLDLDHMRCEGWL